MTSAARAAGVRAAGVLVLELLLAGCSSAGSWSSAGSFTPAVVPPTAAPTTPGAAPAPTTPTTPTATRSAAPAPSRDIAACRDARCEVLVRGTVDVPLDPKFGFRRFTVTFVPPDRTLVSAVGTDGSGLSGGIGGGGRLVTNGIAIEIVRVTAGGVVLRFTPPS